MNMEGDDQGVPRQFSLSVGMVAGLLLMAVLCLGYAWLHRNPRMPFAPDPDGAIRSMLWRTTIVVAVAVAVVIVAFLAGGLSRRRFDRRAQFLAYLSPVLLIVAVGTLYGLNTGATLAIFDAAETAQRAVIPFEVTAAAKAAWWCACLAVLALAVAVAASYTVAADHLSRVFSHPGFTAAVAVAVVIVVTVAVVATTDSSSWLKSRTAARTDAPVLTDVTGNVVYRVGRDDGSNFAVAGTGLVRVHNGTPNVVEGIDGPTGHSRWSFSFTGLSVYSLGATGIGPDSVVVLQTFNGLIGLDATTGTPLWARTVDGYLPQHHPSTAMSPDIILVVGQVPAPTGAAKNEVWTAISPRTGALMWSRTFPYRCYATPHVAGRFVLVQSCQNAPDVLAEVLDAGTGHSTAPLTASRIGFGSISPSRSAVSIDVAAERALVSVRPDDGGPRVAPVIVDVATGAAIRELPADQAGAFIDDRSVLLAPYSPTGMAGALSIMDLQTGAVVDAHMAGTLAISGDEEFQVWTRVGDEWLTFLPADPSPNTPKLLPLRAIDRTGTWRTLRQPCGQRLGDSAALVTIPGAVLVDCSSEWAAIT